jgi:pimeloyl-ACP methyl ester carboxylesterase
MQSTDMIIDVTAAAALGEPVHIAATLHLPDDMADGPLDLIFALHGGGYTRGYWHPAFADKSYSFALFFCGNGKAVLAIDMLGMGESSRPEPESRLNRSIIAAVHSAALAYVIAKLGRPVSVTGLGHSMGGLLIITQAALTAKFDRVAVLGWANEPMILRADLTRSGYLSTLRASMRKLFYWPDVPQTLIEADEASGSTTPACLGRDALTPGIVHAASSQIAVPVLVVQSEMDTSPAPEKEVAYFSSSPRVELQVLQSAAHCQNFASTRAEHWKDLDNWINRTSTASS